MNVLIDDHLLREVLLEGEPGWLRRVRRSDHLFTTGSWYYRLCGALQHPGVVGSLSGPITQLPSALQEGVVERVSQLPAWIELRPLRDVAWSAAGLGREHGLNLLAAEALAVALEAGAAIATAAPNLPPKLATAARAESVRIRVPPVT